MDLADVHPELRQIVRRFPQVPVHRPWLRRLMNLAQRYLSRPAIAAGVKHRDVVDGAVRVRVYAPVAAHTDAALLWIHGGGLVIGHPSQDDKLCSAFARDLGIVVVSVDYRLAPDAVFPAALDDGAAAWAWLQASATTLGIDPARVVVGGQSAGGGLAASLVHRLHDAGGQQPLAQLLFCPMLDDRTAANRALDGVGHFVWTNTLNEFGWSSYLGHATGKDTVAEHAVPARRQQLAGLPPAWIGVGTIDLFHDEDLAYARRLREAGVDVDVEVVAGAPHGFESWARETVVAVAFVDAARAWLRRQLER